MAQLAFEDCENDVGRLVATVDSDPSKWDAITTKSVLGSFFQDRFFYLSIAAGVRQRIFSERPLFHRRLVEACNRLQMPDKERVKQETIRDLLGKTNVPATLEQIVALDRMLAHVAAHGSATDKREITISSVRGGEKVGH